MGFLGKMYSKKDFKKKYPSLYRKARGEAAGRLADDYNSNRKDKKDRTAGARWRDQDEDGVGVELVLDNDGQVRPTEDFQRVRGLHGYNERLVGSSRDAVPGPEVEEMTEEEWQEYLDFVGGMEQLGMQDDRNAERGQSRSLPVYSKGTERRESIHSNHARGHRRSRSHSSRPSGIAVRDFATNPPVAQNPNHPTPQRSNLSQNPRTAPLDPLVTAALPLGARGIRAHVTGQTRLDAGQFGDLNDPEANYRHLKALEELRRQNQRGYRSEPGVRRG